MIYINLLIIILFIITIHEFGHYLAARLFRAEVTDFSIGFGKPIYQYTDRNKTKWRLSLIPLGGYVKIKGLDTIFQKNNNKEIKIGTFQSLSLIKKIIILLSGSFFNMLSVFLCLFFVLFFVGVNSFTNEVGDVRVSSPAEKNDIRTGDLILSINNTNVKVFKDIIKAIGPSKQISLEILRDNILINKNIELEFNEELNRYLLGISNSNNMNTKKFNLVASSYESLIFIPNFYINFFAYLKKSITNNTIANELSGPIGIVKNADKLMLDKIFGVINLFIGFSLSIAILNLLPIPLLDGGHVIYFIIRRIFSDSLPEFITKIYLTVGITTLIFIFLFITFNDIFYK